MTFSALDSALTGPLFASDDMRAVFGDRARLAAMLRMEAALARAQSRFGLAPEALAPAIEAIIPHELDVAGIGTATVLAGVPTIPFVKAVQQKLPKDLEPSFHMVDLEQIDRACTLAGAAFDSFRSTTDQQRAAFLNCVGHRRH